jgi:predicted Zn-dependent protease with MMP-like domain
LRKPILKLRGKLLVGTGLLVLLPILLIGYFVNINVYNTMREQAEHYNSHVGDLINFEIQHIMEQEKQRLSFLATALELLTSKDRSIFLKKAYTNTQWVNLYYVDTRTGHIDFANNPKSLPTGFNPQTTDWYKSALKFNNSVSSAHTDILTGQKVITISLVVKNSKGNVSGVLAADLSVESMLSPLKSKVSETLKDYIWLIDAQNNFLLKPSFTQNQSFETPIAYSPAFLKNVEQHYITIPVSVPELGWHAIVAQDPSTALNDAHKLISETIYITLIFFILSILSVLIYVRRLTKPIDKLLNRINAIKRGAWHRDLPPLKTHFTEIGEVSSAFDEVNEELQELLRDVIISLTTSLDARDQYTRHHSERVSIYARLLAQYLGWSNGETENLLRAGLMHDVGKIGIPEHILNKPGSLTAEEFETMKSHCTSSYEIIQGIPFYVRSGIAEMAYEHHERWDGKGYPRGLKETEILPGARVLAIADAFDAMTSDRAYRKALSLDQALSELEKGKGKQFDAEMVDVFLSIPRKVLLENMNTPLKMSMSRVPLTVV